nr:XRN 5'-3' exonuclease N-terminal domain-containing protein [Saprospiraceae bacterium]
MGVPRLYPWICKNFPHLIKHFQEGHFRMEVDNLYLDSNGLLHPEAQLIFNYGDNKKIKDDYGHLTYEEKRTKTFEKFFQDIEMLTKIVIPKKRLYIAIDGPAPLAKQSQQRERRFSAIPATGKSPVDETPKFSSTEISPGTIFEFELTKYLHTRIRKKMNNDPVWRNIEVIFSPPTCPGEGEHTCLDHMR